MKQTNTHPINFQRFHTTHRFPWIWVPWTEFAATACPWPVTVALEASLSRGCQTRSSTPVIQINDIV